MDNGLFFCNVQENELNKELMNYLQEYSNSNATQIYIISAPLGLENKKRYDYKDGFVILRPKYKICFVNFRNSGEFEDYCDDFLEDLGYLSEKYDYRQALGRPRLWRDKLSERIQIDEVNTPEEIWHRTKISSLEEQRKSDFLISLLIGSINDIDRIGIDFPNNLLEQVKRKIILFDGDQSRFVYAENHDKKSKVFIQGLAGTGKTELLLHKLKDLYVKQKSSRIAFTCFNKILARNMKERIPDFFDFMRVEEQIKWDERLWVMPSWGLRGIHDSGIYSYICSKYDLQYYSYAQIGSFEKACQHALDELNQRNDIECCFDYMLIDESQDFSLSFFNLCEKITKNTVYIAGDIFQDIYDNAKSDICSDYQLNRCYRTDPKTLMFSHAVGMGLFEQPVIRWLDDEEWQACGYTIERSNDKFILSRIPLRRFEDIDASGLKSIEIAPCSSGISNVAKKIIEVIDIIRQDHPSVEPEDIAIAFLGDSNDNYTLADLLSEKISEHYDGWKAIKGYETKCTQKGAVFISNRNNIKGLEFPFIICVILGRVTQDIFDRNTIYMLLTRSFITSYLVINDKNTDFIERYQKAANSICEDGKMIITEPSEEEKRLQNHKVSIEVSMRSKSISEIFDGIAKSYPAIDSDTKQDILNMIAKNADKEGWDEEKIKERLHKLLSVFE